MQRVKVLLFPAVLVILSGIAVLSANCLEKVYASTQSLWLIKVDAWGDTSWIKEYSVFPLGLDIFPQEGEIRQDSASKYATAYSDWYHHPTRPLHDYERAFSLELTPDGGFVVGLEYERGVYNVELGALVWGGFLLKTDSAGKVEWSRLVKFTDDSGQVYLPHVRYAGVTSDGGFIVTGYTWTESDSEEVCLVKTDSSGNSLWGKIYGGPGWDEARYAAQTSDGGYLVAGMTTSFGAGEIDLWFLRTDSMGDTLWTRTYGAESEEGFEKVELCSDDGFIVTADLSGEVLSTYWIYGDRLLRFDSTGELEWEFHPHGEPRCRIHHAIEVADGYVATGSIDKGKFWLFKVDREGGLVWERRFRGRLKGSGRFVTQTADGGYVATGETWVPRGDPEPLYVIKVNSRARHQWHNVIVKDILLCWGEGNVIRQTPDGGYIILGKF